MDDQRTPQSGDPQTPYAQSDYPQPVYQPAPPMQPGYPRAPVQPGYPQAPMQPIRPPAPPVRHPYAFGKGDAAFAGVLLVLGFLFWEWIAPKFVESANGYVSSGLGISLFLFTLCGVTLVYLYRKGIRQTKASLAWLAVTVCGALPFLLYPGTAIYFGLCVFVAASYMVWLSVSCGTGVSGKLSGFVFFDGINQLFVVAFSNFTALFASLRKNSRDRERSKRFMIGLVGVIICLPVLAAVIVLLMRADEGFAELMRHIADALRLENIWHYVWEILLGIPIACYLYGALYGNAHKRHTNEIKKTGLSASIAGAHRIPTVAVNAPLLVFCVIYVLFFIAMGSYLFSAFFGQLPDAYSYAEYARRGFFELCGVAAINLAILAFVWWFARRAAGEHPKRLRFFGGVLSGLTILLVVTAMSKMLLYIGEYGLTRNRVYTFWFMILLLFVFAFLLAWHIRPFNAGKPIVVAVTGLALVLFLANTDGLVAKYNVENYLNGRIGRIDLVMLSNLNDARLPYMEQLAAEAPDPDVRDALRDYFAGNNALYSGSGSYGDSSNNYGGSYNYGSAYDEYRSDYNDYLSRFTIYEISPEAAKDVPYMGRNLVSAAAAERFENANQG
ncbi:MAG: DUF4173 domain-containing protein [Clostridiales bacterium]|nr:DUF4173 domain-containing protein [Clostridiales bacterium]